MSNIIDSIQLSGVTYTIQGSGGGGIPESAFTAYTAATDARIAEDEEVTAAALNELNEAISGVSGNNVVELTQAEYDALVTAGTVDLTAFYVITDATPINMANYYTTAQTDTAISQAVSGKQDTLEAGRGIAITTGITADTVAFNLPISGGTGQDSIIESWAENIAWGNGSHAEGINTQALGQGSHAEGEATTASSQFSHAEGHYTKALNAYEHASGEYNVSNTGSTKADKTLFSVGNGISNNTRHNAFEIRQNGDIYISSGGTDIKLQDNIGGKAIEAGRGITVTTGETADTVSFNLPISAGTGSNSVIENRTTNVASGYSSHAEGENTTAHSYQCHAEGDFTSASGISSHAEGHNTKAHGNYSHSEGNGTKAYGYASHAEGDGTIANNQSEHASGQWNVSNSASTTFGDSGNTLFSVGNGISNNTRHNAFEIRQNGDIYLTKDGQDVKLQDQLGGGEVSSAITSGDTNAVAGGAVYDKFDEVEQVTAAALNNINDRLSEDEEVTAAGLNAVNDKFGGLKLQQITQSAYDALTTKDASTLYIIVN